MEPDPEEIDDLIAELVEVGALVPNGMLGEEFTYNINPEIMKAYYPELYDIYMQELDDTLVELVKRDLLAVEYDEDLKPHFTLTQEGQQVADQLMIGFTDYYPEDDV